MIQLAREHPTAKRDSLISMSQSYVLRDFVGDHQIEDGIYPVRGIGMGLCLIRLEVLKKMAALPDITRKKHHEHNLRGELIGFFNHILVDGAYLSEDFSFCERWTSLCAGEVSALVTENVGHIGLTLYSLPYSMTLRGL